MRIASIASLLLVACSAAYGQAGPTVPRVVTYAGRVVTADGKPVSGAQVTLTTRTGDWDHTAVVGRARSGADGAFMFRDQPVSPDRPAQVLVRAEGFALALARVSPDGENEVTVGPPTSLRVTCVTPDGKGAAGVDLRVSYVNLRTAELNFSEPLPTELGLSLAGRTDAGGVLVLRGFPQRATVRLETNDVRFAHLGYEDGVETRDGPVSPPATVRLRAGGSIAGVVTYSDSGRPAAGVEVTAQSLNLPRAARSGWGRAVTDARGAYRMGQVGDGEYNVMLGTNSDAFRRDWTAAAIPSVRLAAGQHLDGRDLRLTKGVVVSGKVVRADSGKGVANIFVGVHGPDHPATSSMISSARTEADGSYAFRAAPGPNHVYLAAAPPDGYRAPAARDVTIVDGQPLTLDFNLERKPGRPVAGRVVDPDGRPVAGAYLSAEAKDGDTFGAARQTSDERGDFFFEAITPGTLIRGASRGLETPEAVVVNGGEPEVVVRLAKSVRVTLTGVVTDAEGTPLANARVSIIRQAGRFGMSSAHPELTDRQGRYRIAGLVPSGRYTLQVQSPGMGTATAKVELDASKESAEAPPLRIAAVSAPISGVVLDADGRPAAGVSVTLEGDEVDRQATLTDPQGRFEFRVRTGNRFKIRAGTDAPARDVRGGDQDLEIKLK